MRLYDLAYRSELHKRVDGAFSFVRSLPSGNGLHGVTWGPALLGRDEMYLTILGWESIDVRTIIVSSRRWTLITKRQAHMAHIERNHEGMEVIAKILVVAALEIGHFKFVRV